jgi:glyoxylase-like metal-dependent hydrolase (beta-lactamase superfamily II)
MAQVIDQVADGVWLVTSTDVNWVLVAGTEGVTLVDAGFSRSLPRVLLSLQQVGRALEDVTAVVLTHAHPDHIGAAERLRARGEIIEQISAEQVLRAAWRRGVLIAGDALMTAHPTARTAGPQLLPAMFNHDHAAALASLQALAGLPADVVLPGHGPAYRGPASAVEQAIAAHRHSRHRAPAGT